MIPKYKVVAVAIKAINVLVDKERSFKLEIVELFRRLGFQVIYIGTSWPTVSAVKRSSFGFQCFCNQFYSGGKNDREVDIRACFNGIDFSFQCKN
ncbi:7614_t:CDS:2 [Dentiscutata heterogama]|uniref:7614_t:CDS:1 n=1 Tax=Dentiscutata heterogama TaxID=1316150 RepID=A0ACA9N5C2_9GLOM|nr:7614_t:CDS:2 [Dentiscutata heterogama]